MEPRNQTWPFISFPLFLLFNLTLSSAADTLYAGHSLILNQTLISKGGNFELGFFNLGDSPNYYLGIWYKNVSILNRTYVWVANRDNPLHSKNSLKLKLSKGGNLDLFDNATYVVWSTNVIANSVNSPRAVLGDDGNLVLRYGDNPFHVYWQSFDYPTDTVLAGARFGYDKITKKGQSQSSWKNENDPSQGLFSVELDPIAKQFNLLWNRSESYWSSGQWDGQIFTNIPTMKLAKNYNFSYVNNMNESYVTYNTSRVSRMVVNLSGQLVRYEWDEQTKRWFPLWSAPTQQCEVFGFCGAYGVCNENGLPLCKCMQGFQPRNKKEWDMSDFSSGGCVRKSSLECGARDGFFTITNVNLPLKQRSFAASNVDQCKSVCFNNCSCKAYAYRNSCLIWNEDLFGVQQFPGAYVGGGDFFLKLASADIKKPVGTNSTVASKTSRGRNHTVKVAAIVGTVACLLIIALILGYLGFTKRQNKKGNISESEKQQLDLPLFDLCTIEAATNNFSISNKIGHGGFGPVYKGVLATGVEIAVKRLSKESRQGIKEFMNEVIVIAKLQHRNLVRLLGCCIDGAERMLIYEYMPNKSLDFIFDGTRNIELSWEKRCDIIIGIARGLLYLHQDSRLRIIHRDLKAANVLLDNEMNAKISDFGLARILGGDQNEQNTMSIVGTFGYMSPEYATDGLFSTKSDVYSFGVLVLEIISGQRNRGFHCSEHDLNLLGHAWKLLKDKTPLKLLDPSLVESLTMHEALKWIQVGLLCVQKFPEDRPTMETVLSMLESDGAKLPCPQEPGFYTERCPYENGAPSSQGDGFTRNELTHTLLEGR